MLKLHSLSWVVKGNQVGQDHLAFILDEKTHKKRGGWFTLLTLCGIKKMIPAHQTLRMSSFLSEGTPGAFGGEKGCLNCKKALAKMQTVRLLDRED